MVAKKWKRMTTEIGFSFNRALGHNSVRMHTLSLANDSYGLQSSARSLKLAV